MSASAVDFKHLSGGASSLPLSAPLWRPMVAPLSAGVAMTATTTGSLYSPVSPSLRSSAGIVPSV